MHDVCIDSKNDQIKKDFYDYDNNDDSDDFLNR